MTVPMLRQGSDGNRPIESAPVDEPARSPARVESHPCPVCGGPARRFRSESMIARDTAATESSWAVWQTSRGLPPRKLQVGEPSAIDGCDECGSLWRTLAPASLEDYCHYDSDALEEINRRALLDCRADRTWLCRQGVVVGARLLEVSCDAGAFLQFAREQGAIATGMEVDENAVAFTRGLGLDVRLGRISAAEFEAPFDGVWLLNGYEQMAEPQRVLRDVHALLRTGGRVVIRTPNADFARVAYEPGASSRIAIAARFHQVWGLPFARCYTPDALRLLLTMTGFGDVRFRSRPPAGSARSSNAIIDDAAVAPLAPWIDVTATAR
jgi:SAM-dependent methyltransferase